MALSTVNNILQQNPKVLKEPAPVVGIASLSESSISLEIKPWVKVEDFVIAQAEIYQSVIETFREKQIKIPVPLREVHIINQPS